MTTYQAIFSALKNPAMASTVTMPQNSQEWKRFFGMMETLESAKIAEFKNGRYVLHSSQKDKAIVKRTEQLLASISKSLAIVPMPEPVLEAAKQDASAIVVEELAPTMVTCPNCAGKGRVNIEDALGFFGNFKCLTCYGKGKIQKPEAIIPSNETFPPVVLEESKLAESVEPINAMGDGGFVWHDRLEKVTTAEVVETPALVAVAESPANSTECDACAGYGTLVISNKEQTCLACGGSGEKAVAELAVGSLAWLEETEELPVVELPSDELIAELAPLAVLASEVTEEVESPFTSDELDMIRDIFAQAEIVEAASEESPKLVPANCNRCQASGILLDTSDGETMRVRTCPDCGGSGEVDDTDYSDYPSEEEIRAGLAEMRAEEAATVVTDSPQDELITPETETVILSPITPISAEAIAAEIKAFSDDMRAAEHNEVWLNLAVVIKEYAPKSRYVRVNWTSRGLSSGKFELGKVTRQYGKTWYVVKTETDKVYLHHLAPAKCEMVVV